MNSARAASMLLGLIGLALVSRAASAQCTNDPPIGSLLSVNCEDNCSYATSSHQISSRIDGAMLLRFTVVSAVTWWVARQPMRTLATRNPFRAQGGETLRADAVRRRSGF